MRVPHLSMKTVKILAVLQVIVICQAQLYVKQTSNCTWFFTSSENAGENKSTAIFKNQTLYPLATQICHDLNCGDVYQLHQNTTTDNETCLTNCIYDEKKLNNCTQTFEKDCSKVSKVICESPYRIREINSSWSISSLKTKSAVILTAESVQNLASDICEHHKYGEVFQINNTTAPPNSSCLINCTYSNNFLWNCSSVPRNNCSALSEVTCGNQAVRLVNGSHRCAGRVELWHAGQWGTVCDDGWGTSDANVVCAQLNCGYAISVSGQGGPYHPGKGPIFMDELNCTGTESNLWECPALREAHDCGHKEDAAVICSEYKAVRLTGGLDRCSGRVEIHRNGLWGTVCEDCWQKHEANMACSMLGCGGVKQFTGFEKPFTHENGTRWYYNCDTSHKTLWECQELDWTMHPWCKDKAAAGMICNNSLGLPTPTTLNTSTAVVTTQMTTMGPAPISIPWSLELWGCIILSCALLIAIIVNFTLCCLAKKRKKALKIQQKFENLQTTTPVEENNYRDAVNLVKVTNNDIDPKEQTMPPPIWTQSSVESASYDTDYEPGDNNQNGVFPLATFRNSMRYNADGQIPARKGTDMQSVMEEDTTLPFDASIQGFPHTYNPNNLSQGLNSAPSVDSFETSSTSSGECYENTGLSTADLNTETYENTDLPLPDADLLPHPTEDSYQDQNNGLMFNYNQGQDMEQSDGEESPIYSPVSVEPGSYSSDNDYDDVGNFAQTPLT